MRLTKTLELFDRVEKTIIGYDHFGVPIYEEVRYYTTLATEAEPFSPKLAEDDLGLLIEVNIRFFCYPCAAVELNKEIIFRGQRYFVTGFLEYDRHLEILARKEIE